MLDYLRWVVLAAVFGLAAAYVVWGRKAAPPAGSSQVPAAKAKDPALITDASGAYAPPDPNVRKTQLVVEPAVFDFKTVEPDTQHEAVFQVSNPTQKPIQVKYLAPSCSCVSPEMFEKLIPPGGKRELHVNYHARRERREDMNSITLITDEGLLTQASAGIKATIHHEILVDPQNMTFGNVKQGERKEITFAIRHPAGEPFRIKGITAGKAETPFSFTWTPQAEAASVFQVVAACQGWEQAGAVLDVCAIVTDHPKAPLLSFTVAATIQGNIAVEPKAIVTMRHPDGSLAPMSVHLRRAAAGALKVLKVEDSLKRAIAVETKEIGGQLRLTLSLTDPLPPEQTLSGAFLVSIEGEKRPLQIPYTVSPPYKPPATGNAPQRGPAP